MAYRRRRSRYSPSPRASTPQHGATIAPNDCVDMTFRTWEHLVDYVTRGSRDLIEWREKYNARCVDSPRFVGGAKSLDHALDMLANGWAEGADKARETSSPMFRKLSHLVERTETSHAIEGECVDIGLFLAGAPECFQTIERNTIEDTGHKIIKLVYNIGSSSNIADHTIIARGSAVATLVELLELAGHRVEIVICKSNAASPLAGDQIAYQWRALLKASDQPLDMARLMFAIAHPAMIRLINFAMIEMQSDTIQSVIGYKQAYGVSRDMRDADSADLYLARMYSESNESQWNAPEYLKAWLLKTLSDQGIETD